MNKKKCPFRPITKTIKLEHMSVEEANTTTEFDDCYGLECAAYISETSSYIETTCARTQLPVQIM